MKRHFFSVSLALSMWACGCGHSSPTSPSPSSSTFTLSGVVSESTPGGIVPVPGARILTSIGVLATTEMNGSFSILVANGPRNVLLTTMKEGYDTDSRVVYVQADMHLDIRIGGVAILTGVIFETTPAGPMPIEGVELELFSCASFGCQTHRDQAATTGSDGSYSFSGLYNGAENYLWVTKEGFRDPTEIPCEGGTCHQVPVNGYTRFDLQLVRQ